MSKACRKVKHREGRTPITDDQVRGLLNEGKSFFWITKYHKIGVARLRKIDRATVKAVQ